ncbi:DUF455 family protein [Xylanibacillus composti]|uniref:DUF455 family protein n=1 Tax=Xylanibacillus composti TaxID=1572762 RepID=A0A8J4H598_9BACL|nr:DUF455 family protein [Xylanibacillus composti]MDT9726529.1 DUF455 family protein [Xylanibacillus composti]GIQ68948.1 hypothetical protein XYCOK13_17720 [Xylanibacillus composti]
MTETHYLTGNARGTFMRQDTAVMLKRFYLIEQASIIGQAGWLPAIPYFEMKTLIPKMLWEDAMTADMLRKRVIELRFPSRMLEVGTDQPLVDYIRSCYLAPNAIAFMMVMSRLIKPALRSAYQTYLNVADEIGDGPTYRFLRVAIEEKTRHIDILEKFLASVIGDVPQEEVEKADAWIKQQDLWLQKVGGFGLDAPNAIAIEPLTGKYEPAEVPAREDSFRKVRFYWPDIVDPAFPYGTGMQLQLRSAVSHFNEVWAVETGGFILYSFAEELGWSFVFDAARWVYDESRHVRMGYDRLVSWGYEDDELPLGTYIYDSSKGHDPIYRLGMLFYFESKNIGKKIDRIKNFERMQDRMSQHDMDFDWADETIHTGYGKTWLSQVLKNRGQDPDDYSHVKDECERLVRRVVESVSEEEIEEIKQIANHMITKQSQ